jgi:hypothetical protein
VSNRDPYSDVTISLAADRANQIACSTPFTLVRVVAHFVGGKSPQASPLFGVNLEVRHCVVQSLLPDYRLPDEEQLFGKTPSQKSALPQCGASSPMDH